ncbi:MAG: RlmE family RNA methyltransferase [Gammaproteobacteria bacterium]|jgi:23S rRNA (uridine2552-2'-O)-methyltransferase|nr:RlmE family RNA methyltransferase [Gammaproteobacteria bacterium]
MSSSRKRTRRWQREHAADHWVQRSREGGYRSRAVFKLEELDRRERLLRRGARVLDLGAAPGGWSQYAAQRVAAPAGGRVVAVDRLAMDPIPGVDILCGDLNDPVVQEAIGERLGGPADLVISDMAPDITGISAQDAAAVLGLAEVFCQLCARYLRADGAAVCKTFGGASFSEVQALARSCFGTVRVRKPAASRDRSAETYLVCRGLVVDR